MNSAGKLYCLYPAAGKQCEVFKFQVIGNEKSEFTGVSFLHGGSTLLYVRILEPQF